MTRAQLAKAISQAVGIDKFEVDAILLASHEIIKREVTAGRKVDLRGFGTFRPRLHKGHQGRDFKNDKVFMIEDKIAVQFKPSKKYFRERVNEGTLH